MKKLAIYKSTHPVGFDFDEVENILHQEIKPTKMSSLGLIPVYEDGDYYLEFGSNNNFVAFNFRLQTKAGVKDDTVNRLLDEKIATYSEERILEAEEIDRMRGDIVDDIVRQRDVTETNFYGFYDRNTKQFLFDQARNVAEEALSLLRHGHAHDPDCKGITIESEDQEAEVSLFTTEPSRAETMFTGWVVDNISNKQIHEQLVVGLEEDTFPDCFELGLCVELGMKSIHGKSKRSAHSKFKHKTLDVITSSVPCITRGEFVKKLEVGYDGVVYPTIDHTGFISAIRYDGFCSVKDDEEAQPSVNFLSKYNVILPEIVKFLDVLEKSLDLGVDNEEEGQ